MTMRPCPAQTSAWRCFSAHCPKSLLGRAARQRLGARSHCSGVLRSHLVLEIAARAGFLLFDSTRKLCTSAAFSNTPLEITAQACSATTRRSKSLLGCASKPFSARNHCSSKLLLFDNTFVSPSKTLPKSLCFELCFVRLLRHQVPCMCESRILP